ncbi:baseplate J/gp47 family protein [Sphingomonas trueperi]|uniref:baseplate J/gp47 family protein n=1 Tax=Sphingomonas trueperi TaxID=53317 RepID=UPI001C7D6715
MLVTILSRLGDGTASPELLAKISAHVSAEAVRPLTDAVTVQSATILPTRSPPPSRRTAALMARSYSPRPVAGLRSIAIASTAWASTSRAPASLPPSMPKACRMSCLPRPHPGRPLHRD